MNDVISELNAHDLGTVIGYEVEDGDFGISTPYQMLVEIILDWYHCKYTKSYNKKTGLWDFDFNIYAKEEQKDD